MNEKTITDPSEWSFSIDDCTVSFPVNPRTGSSYRVGATNGEHAPTEDASRAARAVVVTHIPTGLSVTKDDFLPFRNKELAIAELKKLVQKWIVERTSSGKENS